MAAIRQLPQQWKWFLAAALIAVLASVTTAQYAVADDSAASLFDNILVLQEADGDDSHKLPGMDDFGAALPAAELAAPSRPARLFSTTFYLSAAYLTGFIIAPSRAPPPSRF